MKYKLVLHPAAARELEEAYCWIAVESKPKADRWYNNLIKQARYAHAYSKPLPTRTRAKVFR